MTYFKNDMFKLLSQIDTVIKVRGTTLDAKRRIVKEFNPLFYAMGYELESKPWLTYNERYEIK